MSVRNGAGPQNYPIIMNLHQKSPSVHDGDILVSKVSILMKIEYNGKSDKNRKL